MKRQIPIILGTLFLFFLAENLQAQVVINEYSAANHETFFDNYGDDSDWIELYNTGSTIVDLAGYHLSDGIDNPTKFEIPAGVSIAPQEFLLVWCSGREEFEAGVLHTDFKIKQTRSSEDIVFADPSGSIIDTHPIGIPNKRDHSRGKLTDGGSEWGVFMDPTPGNPNGSDGFSEYASEPMLSPDGGYHGTSVFVTITSDDPNVTIHYTLDGSFPDDNSPVYSNPIEVTSTSVVQAIAYHSDPMILPSHREVNSYFMGDDQHTLPVVSIAGGDQLQSLLEGEQNEPTGSLEYFNADMELMDEGLGEFNKHGNDSWAYDQRGIDFISRDEFGIDDEVSHQIFAIKDRDNFQRLIFKAAANDNYPAQNGAHIRDAYVHTLSQLADLEMDERTNQPIIIYVNGQYWGLYEVREKVDDHDYTKYYYDQGKEWIDFIKTWGGTWEEYGSIDDWDALVDFILNNDMSDAANYTYVEGELNVISLIDYFVLHSHNVSADWLNWNTGWWRGRKPTGGALKWRYILWDEDATYGHYINYTGIPDTGAEADPCDPEVLGDPGGQGHVPMLNALLENDDFFALYISRYADLNNTFFTCDFMLPLLDSMIAELAPEMTRHVDRWGGTVGGWEGNVQELRDFISARCIIIDDAIVDCYDDEGISGPYELTIDVSPAGSGQVKANTIVGQNYPWSATYFGGIDLTLTAIPEAGGMFSHWEVNNNLFTPDQFADVISFALESGDEITAFFVPAVPCPDAFNLVADTTQFGAAFLTWSGPSEFVSYELQYREENVGADWEVFSVLDPTYAITGLEECKDYEVQLRVICSQNFSDYIDFSFSSACSTVNTEELESGLQKLQVYPNPFSNALTVGFDLQQASDIQVKLFTINGQEILSQSFDQMAMGENKVRLDLDETLSAGMYLVRVTSNKGTIVRQVVKQ